MSDLVLMKLGRCERLLAECTTAEGAKELIALAEAARVYAQRINAGLEVQNRATEYKLRAERRLGEILDDNIKHQGGRPVKNGASTGTVLPRGVNKHQSSRAQRIASIPSEDFEAHIAKAKQSGKPLAVEPLVKIAVKAAKKKARQKIIIEHDATSGTSCTLESLIAAGTRFSTIYADPPWPYDNQGTRASTDNYYDSMSVADIAAMPIPRLAADQAHLHLWTTAGFLRESFTVLDAWGFEYKGLLVWAKPKIGMGNYWRNATEFLLLGVRGNLEFLDRSKRNWVELEREKHSTKPAELRRLVECVSPGPRLELFARELIEGWTSWGNELPAALPKRVTSGTLASN